MIRERIAEHIKVAEKLFDMESDIRAAADIISEAYMNGGKAIAFGNGGSAADAQHLIAELVGRFLKDRKPLPGLALSTNTSIMTAIANDYGYDAVFSRQVEGNAKKGDVAIGISTSGNSKNVNLGLEKAKELGCKTIGLGGRDGGKMKELCDICLIVPSDMTPRIQEAHIAIIHMICEIVETDYE